jgi:hypothetical protein
LLYSQVLFGFVGLSKFPMASTDVKSAVEKSTVERRSFTISDDEDVFQENEMSTEDREFLETFGEERRKAVIRKVRHAKLVLQMGSNKPDN